MNFKESQTFSKIDILLSDSNGGNITKTTHDHPTVFIHGKHMIVSTVNEDESWTNTIYRLNRIKVFKTHNK